MQCYSLFSDVIRKTRLTEWSRWLGKLDWMILMQCCTLSSGWIWKTRLNVPDAVLYCLLVWLGKLDWMILMNGKTRLNNPDAVLNICFLVGFGKLDWMIPRSEKLDWMIPTIGKTRLNDPDSWENETDCPVPWWGQKTCQTSVLAARTKDPQAAENGSRDGEVCPGKL